jgi:hypothetical protein
MQNNAKYVKYIKKFEYEEYVMNMCIYPAFLHTA